MKKEILKYKTINNYLTANVRTLEVFKQFGVPMNVSHFDVDLKDICKDLDIDCLNLSTMLDKVIKGYNQPVHDYENWDLKFLIDYILNTHHRYNKISLPILINYAIKIDKEIKGNIFLNNSIVNACNNLKKLVSGHMEKEENILFPYIIQIQNRDNPENKSKDHRGLVKPINVLKQEHNDIHRLIIIIESILGEISDLEYDSENYNSLVYKLQEFKEDMIVHHHIEINILFRRALLIERQQQYN